MEVASLLNAPERRAFVYLHPLQRELTGLLSTRRRAYRVFYELDVDEQSIEVLRIEH
jgi:mRNA-degrading endonuclease RelE of RelBE toxin-antitoxin system